MNWGTLGHSARPRQSKKGEVKVIVRINGTVIGIPPCNLEQVRREVERSNGRLEVLAMAR